MTEISSTFVAVNRITSVDDGIKLWLSTWLGKKLSCCELIAYLISLNLLTGLPVASALYKMLFFVVAGGGGSVVGVYRPPHLIFTLFQSNIYKVNVREFLP